MIDFVSTQSLHHAVLNSGDPSVKGWVFFSVKDRWIGPWHKPEQFVLRCRRVTKSWNSRFHCPLKITRLSFVKDPRQRTNRSLSASIFNSGLPSNAGYRSAWLLM